MAQVEVLNADRDRAGGYKVDVNRGERVGRVSSEWFSRPADERYLSLSDLYAAVRGRTQHSRTRTVETAAIRVEASRDDAERLALMLPGSGAPIAPTHWSFGQLASEGQTVGSLNMASMSGTSISRTFRRHQLSEMVPIADSTIYEMEQRGEFPRRFSLSPRCVVWDLSEVEAWLEARRTRPIMPAKGPDVRQRRTRPVKATGRAPASA